MRLEQLPIVFGILIMLIGVGLIADAWLADDHPIRRERRRRRRAERSRTGEALFGVASILVGAALIGRDTWRYETLSVLIAGLLMVVAIVLNRRYLKEVLTYRGPARRDPTTPRKPGMPDTTSGERLRIR